MEYFYSARQAELAWGRDPGVVQDLCRRKEVPGAFKGEDGRYKIPKGPEPPGLPRRDKLTEEGREIAHLAHAGRTGPDWRQGMASSATTSTG